MIKKGQITVFVMIGILIVALISFSVYFSFAGKEKLESTAEKTIVDAAGLGKEAQVFAQNCVNNVAKDSVLYLADHGGYVYGTGSSGQNIKHIEYNGENRPYYFYLAGGTYPDEEELKQEFAAYVSKELLYCMVDLNDDEEKGYEISFAEPVVDIILEKESINFNIGLNLDVKTGDTTKQFNSFNTVVATSFPTLYKAAKNITITQMQYPDFIIRSNVIDIAEKYQLKIDTISISETDVIYELLDENNKINGEALRYVFAFKYDWGEVEEVGGGVD